MKKESQTRVPLENYHEDGPLSVFHMLIRDNLSGSLIMSWTGSVVFKNLEKTDFEPNTAPDGELSGLYITHNARDEGSSIVFVFTPKGDLHLISNDEYFAKKMLVEMIFGSSKNFNDVVPELVLSETWTGEPEFFFTLLNALR